MKREPRYAAFEMIGDGRLLVGGIDGDISIRPSPCRCGQPIGDCEINGHTAFAHRLPVCEEFGRPIDLATEDPCPA